jgi:hypothetical protein
LSQTGPNHGLIGAAILVIRASTSLKAARRLSRGFGYSTGRHNCACGVGFEDTLALIRKLRSKSGIHPATLRLLALVQCLILWKTL